MKKGMIMVAMLAGLIVFAGLADAAKPATVTTDKASYALGEIVTVYVSNDGNQDVTIRGGFYVTTQNGEPVYDPYWAIIYITILPGGVVTYHWNQTFANSAFGADGQPVSSGNFVVRQFSTTSHARITIS
jgi:hypothetical protein